jgi:hypothetical protein
MSVDTIQTIGIIGSLVVATASIIVSIWQSRLQTKALKSATYAQLQSRVDALNAFLIDHCDLLAALYPQDGQDNEPAFTVRALIMDRFLSLFCCGAVGSGAARFYLYLLSGFADETLVPQGHREPDPATKQTRLRPALGASVAAPAASSSTGMLASIIERITPRASLGDRYVSDGEKVCVPKVVGPT